MRAALDPSDPLNEPQLKGSITDAIVKDVVGVDRDDVVDRVEAEYERLLTHAAIFTHIPSLTAGMVLRTERQLLRARKADLRLRARKVPRTL